jgi:TonB-linked SusC/RagA family outer membrane protein
MPLPDQWEGSFFARFVCPFITRSPGFSKLNFKAKFKFIISSYTKHIITFNIRHFQLLTLVLILVVVHLHAQPLEISGTVTSSDEQMPLPGVSIIILGTTSGTITDSEGNYKIQVQSGATLQYSYIGYIIQEVEIENQTILDISLGPDVAELQEVIITSLGVTRQKKALGYSITEVDGDKFTEAREKNLSNALTGRIAGVNVTRVAGGPASSTRVIIRGNKSLEGRNQPLYVVDGVPINNWSYGQAGVWGGRDQGDGLVSISPDDIESIEVLKGANASALYGARAGNGVINITTKKGKARKGIGVEFLTNYVIESLYDQRDLQREYGQGDFVRVDPIDPESEWMAVAPRDQTEGTNWNTTSWGPVLGNGTFVGFDGIERPYVDAGDQYSKFFETGYTWTNSLALTGGSPQQNFRFSATDLRNTSVVPNASFNRFNTTLSTNSKFGKKLSLTAKIMYSHEDAKNRPRLSDSPMNLFVSMLYLPANSDVDWYIGDPDKPGAIPPDQDQNSLSIWGRSPGQELPAGQHNWHQNPWWVAYQNEYRDITDRIIGSGQLRYDFTDYLYIQGRIGMDWSVRRITELTPQGTGYQRSGFMAEREVRRREINLDYLIGFNDIFGPISVNAFFGGSTWRRVHEGLHLNGYGFNVPFEEFINNTAIRNFGYGYGEGGINSLFGQAEIGLNGYLFLTGTIRNDWFSYIHPDYNSVLYPSIGLSFVFSDIIKSLPSWFSYGKVRGSWAQVGNVTTTPYLSSLTYSINSNTHVGYTMASFSTAMGINGIIPNPQLTPQLSTEMEIGLDVRFFNNRLGLDFTFYDQKTTDDILRTQVSGASGFGRTDLNIGEVTNRGVEVLLYGTAVSGALNWDISFNFAKNDNEVVSLVEGVGELPLEEPRTRTVRVKHIEGYPYGMLTGWIQKKTPDGRLLYMENGEPVRSDDYEIIGYGVPDFTGGLENTFTWKNINLSFLIDFKYGGDVFSGTNVRLTQAGLTKMTLEGREGKDPLQVSGAIQSGTTAEGEPVYEDFNHTLTPEEASNYWNRLADRATDHFIYDASFAKLRHLTLGYNFPQKLLAKSPISTLMISFVGRDLLVLWKNVDNIDPESSYTNSNSQGLEYFGMPAVRSYGFNLKVTF